MPVTPLVSVPPTVIAQPTAADTAAVASASSSDKPSDTSPFLGGIFDRKEQISLNSRIKAVRDQDKQRMAFMLENDEIWIQTSPRNLPFKEGDDVTIKSA